MNCGNGMKLLGATVDQFMSTVMDLKFVTAGAGRQLDGSRAGGGGKKGVEREVGGRREAMKCGLIQGNRKKYRETIQSHLVLKEWDGDEGQCKGLGFNGSPVDFLGKVDHLCKNRHDDCSA